MRNSIGQKRFDLLLIFKRVLNQLHKSYLVHISPKLNCTPAFEVVEMQLCNNAPMQQDSKLESTRMRLDSASCKIGTYIWSNLAQNGKMCNSEWMLSRFFFLFILFYFEVLSIPTYFLLWWSLHCRTYRLQYWVSSHYFYLMLQCYFFLLYPGRIELT